ncbi:MAG: PilZ domain-containing protein [Candidatus Marinimicrobia bacterium]|nr:PilZ domain-containing protein [Candidatus Neomarinimicrobiota bacterium]
MALDKRKRSRVPFDVDVHFNTSEDQIRSKKLQDISMSGLYFESDIIVPLGTTGTVKLHLESGEQTIIITANGKVTRSIPAEQNSPGGIGVEFTEIDTDSSIHLFNVIRYQLGDDSQT